MTHSSRDRWVHPLISGVDPSLNRRRLIVLGASGLASGVAATLAARSGPNPAAAQAGAQEATPAATPQASPVATPDLATIGEGLTGEPDAVALLRNAAAVMAGLATFQFEIETTRGQSTIFQGLDVRAIAGAVRRPLDFTATVSVGVPFGTIDVTAIGIEGRAWVQDPLAGGLVGQGGSEWIALEGTENIVALINPDTLILNSIGVIQDARIDDAEQIDGADATVISGTVDFAATAERVTGQAVELPAEVSAEPLPVLVWIDGEGRVLEVEISGRIVATESEDVVRVARFYGFNEPVDIEAPPV